MVEVRVDGVNVRFRLLGRDRLLAVKRKVDVPAAHIAGVRRAGGELGRPRGLRLGGASFPGVIYAGSFWRPGSWTFWDIRPKRPENVIIVDLKDDFYTQLVVEVRDADAAITAIEQARAMVA